MAYDANRYTYKPKDQKAKEEQKLAISRMGKNEAVQKRFQEVLGAKAPSFIASVIGAVNGNSALQDADPSSVFGSAMIAATLNLSVVPTLGQAALVPYRKKGGAMICQFQIMVRGLVQLAQRTGLYKTINAGEVYEDEYVDEDMLTGDISFQRIHGGYRDSGRTDKIIGYFAFMETTTGFRKTEYWTREDVINHAQRYSKTYESGPWQENFDAMARKTVLKSLLNHYGPMSVDSALAQAITKDQLVVDKDGTASYEDSPMDSFIAQQDASDNDASDAPRIADNASVSEKQEKTPVKPQDAPEASYEADSDISDVEDAFGAPISAGDDGWGEPMEF